MASSSDVSSTREEYLEAIHRLEEAKSIARTSDIAKHMSVALGTVTNTIESMETQGLVTRERYKGVKLTRKGRKMALDILRRHRLSERLLTDILRLEWSKVHDAACKLEHVVGNGDIMLQMSKVLGNPKTCPHGNPIPSKSGKIVEDQCEPLTDLEPGTEGTVVKITDERPELLQYFSTHGILPGADVKIVEKAPFEGPLTFMVTGVKCTVGRKVSSAIWLQRKKNR